MPRGAAMTDASRHFPPPWHADKIAGGYIVQTDTAETADIAQPPVLPRPCSCCGGRDGAGVRDRQRLRGC